MIFLSFDIEEFDTPLPYSKTLSFEEQMSISKLGTERILDALKEKKVSATFFCTANFAINAPHLIHRMVNEGHEVASHGYFHDSFEITHLKESKEALMKLSGQPITGFRMANMRHVDAREIKAAGYDYNSSLNPTYLPGKYNNFDKPRRLFFEEGLCQIPASVSPVVRIPLFWLAMHNFPMSLYTCLCHQAVKKDGYLNVYFHPWEFADLHAPEVKLPSYIVRNSGDALVNRLGVLIDYFRKRGIPFGTLNQCNALFGK